MTVRITTLEQSALIQTAIEKSYDALTFRNYPALDPDNLYVWWYNGDDNPVNFMGFNDPEVNRLLDAGRGTADQAQRQQIYQDLNTELARQNYMLWASWTIWAVPMNPDFHGVVGARPPDGGSDYTGLAVGNDSKHHVKTVLDRAAEGPPTVRAASSVEGHLRRLAQAEETPTWEEQ